MSDKIYVKVFGKNMINKNYQYRFGLNDIDRPFEVKGDCVHGRLYFTDLENLHEYLDYGNIIHQVKVLEFDSKGNKVQFVKLGNKYGASCIEVIETDICNLLNENKHLLRFKKYSMDMAALYGHLDIIKWLHENNKSCTTKAMNWAAQHGYLEIVKFLHENRIEGCTTEAMNEAARNGHLEIVKFLHENRTEGCTTKAMGYAAQNGHLEIVNYLKLN